MLPEAKGLDKDTQEEQQERSEFYARGKVQRWGSPTRILGDGAALCAWPLAQQQEVFHVPSTGKSPI